VRAATVALFSGVLGCAQGRSPAYSVSGRLFDRETRLPLVDALVVTPEIGDTTRTGSDGTFRLAGRVDPGCYRLRVAASSYALSEFTLDLTRQSDLDLGDRGMNREGVSSSVVPVKTCSAPRRWDRWDWTIGYGTIRGRVTTPDGLVRAGLPVRTDCPAAPDSTWTDGAGYYRLNLRVPFSERARLEPSGRLYCRVWIGDSPSDTLVPVVRFGPTPWAHRPAIASFGAPRFQSMAWVSLRGRLLDASYSRPLERAFVGILDLNLGASTDADGAFVLRFQSPPGCLRLVARMIGFDAGEGLLRINGAADHDLGDIPMYPAIGGLATHPIAGAQDRCVPSSPVPPLPLARFGSVVGRLIAANGEPAADVGVGLACGTGISAAAKTDENGFFVMDVAFRRWVFPLRSRRDAAGDPDSVRVAGSWDCYFGSIPVRVPLRDDRLSITPVVIDQLTDMRR
jgi:hypothetical protein